MILATPKYSLPNAKAMDVCRLCGDAPTLGPGLPFLGSATEHAHEECLAAYHQHVRKQVRSFHRIPKEFDR